MRNRHKITQSGRVLYIPVGQIRPNPAQPRRIFDPQALAELADSIRTYGILQPLTVRKMPGGFELVAGERRLRAARMAGLAEVPCLLLEVDERQSGMIALVENLQRRDLDYMEEAAGLARLMQTYGLNQEQAAAQVGKSQSAVANKLRLLKLGDSVLEALQANHLTERHARALLRLPDDPARLAALEVIVRDGLTVARTEQYIEQLLTRPAEPKPQRPKRILPVRDVRLFLNTVKHSLEVIQSAGINAACGREDTEDEIVLTIRLPKRAG